MHIGLFFGSFNPIHIGHLMLAQAILEDCSLDKVWFVLSPQSPYKSSDSLASEYDRQSMLELAIKSNYNFQVSTIEFQLPKPSYTYATCAVLREKHPEHTFSIIMGSDNLIGFQKWKLSEQIAKHHQILAYNRKSFPIELIPEWVNYSLINAPHLEISASEIRNRIKSRKSIEYLVSSEVQVFLDKTGLYQ